VRVAGHFSFRFYFSGAAFMTQADLNRAVAAATGETVERIAHHGFGFIEMPPLERDPLVFDWDSQDARLLGAICD
jgi:hypothetical protein